MEFEARVDEYSSSFCTCEVQLPMPIEEVAAVAGPSSEAVAGPSSEAINDVPDMAVASNTGAN